MGAVALALPRTWRHRMLGEHPELVLDRPYGPMVAASSPLPGLYQTDFPPDHFAQLPQVVGRYPASAQLIRLALTMAEADVDAAGLALPRDPAIIGTLGSERNPAFALANRARHTTFLVTAPADEETPLLPFQPYRTYLLIVNDGAAEARIAYDRAATVRSLPLAAAGGFHELTMGTVSEVRGLGVGAAVDLIITEGIAYPTPRPAADADFESELGAFFPGRGRAR
jgi:hypothetical protein